MTISLWAASRHHPAFRCGSWANVRLIDGTASGHAGGERSTTAVRMALAGLIAGLRDLPPTGEIAIHTSGAGLAVVTAVLAGGAEPEDDLDHWRQILKVTKARRVTLVTDGAGADSPLSFAEAWAALAMDKAKIGGTFAAAIPRSNLAKVAW